MDTHQTSEHSLKPEMLVGDASRCWSDLSKEELAQIDQFKKRFLSIEDIRKSSPEQYESQIKKTLDLLTPRLSRRALVALLAGIQQERLRVVATSLQGAGVRKEFEALDKSLKGFSKFNQGVRTSTDVAREYVSSLSPVAAGIPNYLYNKSTQGKNSDFTNAANQLTDRLNILTAKIMANPDLAQEQKRSIVRALQQTVHNALAQKGESLDAITARLEKTRGAAKATAIGATGLALLVASGGAAGPVMAAASAAPTFAGSASILIGGSSLIGASGAAGFTLSMQTAKTAARSGIVSTREEESYFCTLAAELDKAGPQMVKQSLHSAAVGGLIAGGIAAIPVLAPAAIAATGATATTVTTATTAFSTGAKTLGTGLLAKGAADAAVTQRLGYLESQSAELDAKRLELSGNQDAADQVRMDSDLKEIDTAADTAVTLFTTFKGVQSATLRQPTNHKNTSSKVHSDRKQLLNDLQSGKKKLPSADERAALNSSQRTEAALAELKAIGLEVKPKNQAEFAKELDRIHRIGLGEKGRNGEAAGFALDSQSGRYVSNYTDAQIQAKNSALIALFEKQGLSTEEARRAAARTQDLGFTGFPWPWKKTAVATNDTKSTPPALPKEQPIERRAEYNEHFRRVSDISEELETKAKAIQAEITDLRNKMNDPAFFSQAETLQKQINAREAKLAPFTQMFERRELERKSFQKELNSSPSFAQAINKVEQETLARLNREMEGAGYTSTQKVSTKTGADMVISAEGYGGITGAVSYRKKVSNDEIEVVLKAFDRTNGRSMHDETVRFNKKTGQMVFVNGKHGNNSQTCLKCHSSVVGSAATRPADLPFKALLDAQ